MSTSIGDGPKYHMAILKRHLRRLHWICPKNDVLFVLANSIGTITRSYAY